MKDVDLIIVLVIALMACTGPGHAIAPVNRSESCHEETVPPCQEIKKGEQCVKSVDLQRQRDMVFSLTKQLEACLQSH